MSEKKQTQTDQERQKAIVIFENKHEAISLWLYNVSYTERNSKASISSNANFWITFSTKGKGNIFNIF